MRPMPTVMMTCDASTRLGAPMMLSIPVRAGAVPPGGVRDRDGRPAAAVGAEVRGTLVGRGDGEDGRAEQHERDEKRQPRVHSGPPDGRRRHRHGSRRDSQGNQYMRSMAKLITAWIAVCGTCRPQAWTDWTVRTTNQDEEAGEDRVPRHVGTERPPGHEHPAHGHTHEDVGHLDVAAAGAMLDGRRHQQREAVERRPQASETDEVVQPGGWCRWPSSDAPSSQRTRPPSFGVTRSIVPAPAASRSG